MKAGPRRLSNMLGSIEVIGATSPLGTFLVERLIAAGVPLTATYRSPILIPRPWYSDPQISLRHLDLTQNAPHPVTSETVVWLAHIDAGRFNADEPARNLAALNGFLGMLDPAVTRKFIFVSSGGSVYGEVRELPTTEYHSRAPLSSYGEAKKALEDRIIEFGRTRDVKTAILRPGNIYGFERPERGCKGVINAFLRSIVDNSRFTLIHSGRAVRDFIHVDDVCSAIMLAANSDRGDVVWNVATGIGTLTADVLDLILEISGKPRPEIDHIENYSSDVLTSILSNERARIEGGWTPSLDLHSGLAKTLLHWGLASEKAASGPL